MQGQVLVLFLLVRKGAPYLLLWERGLDHGSLKAVHPLELCPLPQGLEDLHRAALCGQRFCKQALKKTMRILSGAFSPKSILSSQWENNQGLVQLS